MEPIQIASALPEVEKSQGWAEPSTSTDREPYVLTTNEEAKAIEHELVSLKKFHAWRLRDKGAQEGEILLKLAQTDWEAILDKGEVLQRANAAKNHLLWEKQKRAEESAAAAQKAKDLFAYWTAGRFLTLMRLNSEAMGKPLIENKDTMPLIKAICLFMSRDQRFEEMGYSLKKGLLIRGVSGLGKTHLVRCVADNKLNPITILSMIEITDLVKANGEYEINISRGVLYLDDVGTETTPVKYYGTEIHWFKDYLELFYTRRFPYENLIISTNLDFNQIEAKYGFRVRSRVKDIFNIIDVTGKDLRG